MSPMRIHSRLTIQRPVAPRRKTREGGPLAAPGPIVKWVGGKSRLLGELLSRTPNDYLRYHEPFVGGAALFFALAPRQALLSDANPELVNVYRSVRDEVEQVILALAKHRVEHDEDHYYATRERWNAGKASSPAARAAAFIYLNKTCYNGLWRVNSKGGFNVPMGRYEDPPILDADGLRAASRALAGIGLKHAGFADVLETATPGDFVYFDPPYDPVSDTSDFTAYTMGGFGKAQQEQLAHVFRELHGRGCAVMLSNSDTPLIRKLYAGFRLDKVFCARAINSKADARGAVAELIVTNRF